MEKKMAAIKKKRRILAAKNKGLKRVRKVKKIEVQMDEKELWRKLNELNANFAKMKELKKKNKKITIKKEDSSVNRILFLSVVL